MKYSVIAAIAATSIFVSGSTAGTISDKYTSYYAFGDSLTDDGKLPDSSLHPISDNGRFSNGRTWAEYIADEFAGTGKNTANLAIGGATGNDFNFFPINALSTFAGQIATFSASIMTGDPLPVRTSNDPADVVVPQATKSGGNPLVSILFGGNDLFQSAALSAMKGISVTQVLQDAADAVADGIRQIAALRGGNKFNDFLVLTLPDDGSGASVPYNSKLSSNIISLRGEGLNIMTLDTTAVFGEIIGDTIFNGSMEFGITDFTTPCVPSLSDPMGPAACSDPDAFALTDTVHPNRVVHEVLGARAITTLEASLAPVPLPAGLPLLLVGLGAFGVMRARKAA